MNNTSMLIVGVVMTIIGMIIPFQRLKRRASCHAKVEATVVEVEIKTNKREGGRRIHKHFPVFSYTVDGKEYTTKSDVDVLNVLKYQKGNEVVIRYNPESPDVICVGVKIAPYAYGILLMAVGISRIVAFISSL